MKSFQITEYCHRLVECFCENAELCIDATMGNGHDTLFLCRLSNPDGKVKAFDIQEKALANTTELLEKEGCAERAELVMDSHENIDKYAEPETADVIMFNFGYLPGGDHSLSTRADTSLTAVKKCLDILKSGGIMSLCIYSGGDSGCEEKDALLSFLKALDRKKYIVVVHEYFNRPNNPPVPVIIKKL
ncbi:MAG: class I SAM-dependent methyltransferase [Bacillota bacterium]|nr:class I SAM-dependent methyltransferase [Bacillota bacterium]